MLHPCCFQKFIIARQFPLTPEGPPAVRNFILLTFHNSKNKANTHTPIQFTPSIDGHTEHINLETSVLSMLAVTKSKTYRLHNKWAACKRTPTKRSQSGTWKILQLANKKLTVMQGEVHHSAQSLQRSKLILSFLSSCLSLWRILCLFTQWGFL